MRVLSDAPNANPLAEAGVKTFVFECTRAGPLPEAALVLPDSIVPGGALVTCDAVQYYPLGMRTPLLGWLAAGAMKWFGFFKAGAEPFVAGSWADEQRKANPTWTTAALVNDMQRLLADAPPFEWLLPAHAAVMEHNASTRIQAALQRQFGKYLKPSDNN